MFSSFPSVLKSLLLLIQGVLCITLSAERAYEISNQQGSVRLHVIEFSSAENIDFELVDGVKALHRTSVTDFYDEDTDVFIVNGGYFDGNLNPIATSKLATY